MATKKKYVSPGVDAWDSRIRKYAKAYGVPYGIARGLLSAESGGNPRAYSSAGAVGLMQLMPSTAREMGVDINDNDDNIKGGMKYLRKQYDRLLSWPLAVAAYNGGYARAKSGKWKNIKETREHVEKVVAIAEKYGFKGDSETWTSDIESVADPYAGRVDISNPFNKSARYDIGVPYKFGGTNSKGLDCSAFSQRTYSRVNINIPRTAHEQYAASRKISREELEPGDLVFLRGTQRAKGKNYVSHVGVYAGNNQVWHASTGSGKVVLDTLWSDKKRWVGYARPAAKSKVYTEQAPDIGPGQYQPSGISDTATERPGPIGLFSDTLGDNAPKTADEEAGLYETLYERLFEGSKGISEYMTIPLEEATNDIA